MPDEQSLYARMVEGAPMESITFSAAPKGPGRPRTFRKDTPWVEVPGDTAKFLSTVQFDGETLKRGGRGGPLFEVVTYDRMMEIVAAEQERATAIGAGGVAYQHYLRASADAEARGKVLKAQEQAINAKMAEIDAKIAHLEKLAGVVSASAPAEAQGSAATGEAAQAKPEADEAVADKAAPAQAADTETKPKRVGQRRTAPVEEAAGEP